MRFDLTPDEADLLMRLCSGCDDSDPQTQRVAGRLERYFREALTHHNKRANSGTSRP